MLVTLTRTGIFYIILIICMRLLGKRQVGELQPSELVLTILISEMASIPMQDINRPLTNGIIAIFILVILELLFSVLTIKSQVFRRLFTGKHAIVIKNGVIDQKMLKKLRISVDDLQEALRQKGYFNIEEIAWAILETNGKLSVLPYMSQLPATKKDLNINTVEKSIPITVISDGKLIKEAFKSEEIKKEIVFKHLSAQNLMIEDVFLMTETKENEYIIIRKQNFNNNQ